MEWKWNENGKNQYTYSYKLFRKFIFIIFFNYQNYWTNIKITDDKYNRKWHVESTYLSPNSLHLRIEVKYNSRNASFVKKKDKRVE